MSGSFEPVATVVNGHTFTIDTRYVLKESRILGKGSFGVVCTAYDSVRKINIAIKRIRPYSNDEWDARHTLREIRLLKLLGPHPNIVSLYELSLFEPKTELYMMMELMDCDMHRVIQSKQPLTEKHHKCFVKQILEAIKAMHAIGVFHRDLKPGNILVSKDCQIRITDFGLARFMDDSTRSGQNDLNPMTEYVVTRWYRCPELLLSPNRPYSEAIDLWSIGCILAELIKRKPLFPGKSHAHQVQLVFEVVGFNNSADLGFPVTSEALSFLDKRCKYRKQPLAKFIPEASPMAMEMLEALLAVNPAHRPSAAAACNHPFLADAELLNDYSRTYLTRPTPDYFNFEHERYTVAQLKDMIDNEVYTASASAYRASGNEGSGPGSASSLSSQGGSGAGSNLSRGSQHHTSNYDLSGGQDDSGDGPISQLATQVKNTRLNNQLAGAAADAQALRSTRETANNPFRTGPSNSVMPPQPEYTESINNHNILTAVRNDLIGGSNPTIANNMKSARKSAPKTPSPRKIDIILHKDSLNKQKAVREAEAEELTARTDGSSGDNGNNYYANIFARRTNHAAPQAISGAPTAGNVGAANNVANKRFGRLMSAFPSLPGGGAARSNGAGAAITNSGKVYGKGGANNDVVANNLNNINTRSSSTMMHSGSNVIHYEH